MSIDMTTLALAKSYADSCIRSYGPFPEKFKTDGTFVEFMNSVITFEDREAGCAWLGEVSCTTPKKDTEKLGWPTDLQNAEVIVTMMTKNIAVFQISSSNLYPYKWEYNSASYNSSSTAHSNNWKTFVEMPELPSDFTSKTYTLKFVNGTATWVEG